VWAGDLGLEPGTTQKPQGFVIHENRSNLFDESKLNIKVLYLFFISDISGKFVSLLVTGYRLLISD